MLSKCALLEQPALRGLIEPRLCSLFARLIGIYGFASFCESITLHIVSYHIEVCVFFSFFFSLYPLNASSLKRLSFVSFSAGYILCAIKLRFGWNIRDSSVFIVFLRIYSEFHHQIDSYRKYLNRKLWGAFSISSVCSLVVWLVRLNVIKWPEKVSFSNKIKCVSIHSLIL